MACTYVSGMPSRYLHPLACRVSRKERAAFVAAAARRNLPVSRFIKNLIAPYLVEVDAVDNINSVNTSVNDLLFDADIRPTVSPANRAPSEAPSTLAGRSGFMEKLK